VHVGDTQALTLKVDRAGRLEALEVEAAGVFLYCYGPLGRLKEVTDGSGVMLAAVATVGDQEVLRVPGKSQGERVELADIPLPDGAMAHLQLTTDGARIVSRLLYDGLSLPVWGHAALPHGAPSPHQALARACTLRAMDPTQRAQMPALQTHERWLRALATRCPLTGLPVSVLPLWWQPLARSYVLQPGARDPVGGHEEPLQPLRYPVDLRRSPDSVITGPHQRDALWPTAWLSRATHPAPLVPAGIVRRGGPSPREMLEWIDREGR